MAQAAAGRSESMYAHSRVDTISILLQLVGRGLAGIREVDAALGRARSGETGLLPSATCLGAIRRWLLIFGTGRLEANLENVEKLARISGEAARNLEEVSQAFFEIANDVRKRFISAFASSADSLTTGSDEFRMKVGGIAERLGSLFGTLADNTDKVVRAFAVLIGGGIAARGATAAAGAY